MSPNSLHYSDVTTSLMASQNTSNSTVHSTICLSQHKKKHQRVRYWPFVMGIHRWPVDSPHKGPVMWKVFPLCDIIMCDGLSSVRPMSSCTNGISESANAFILNIIVWKDLFQITAGNNIKHFHYRLCCLANLNVFLTPTVSCQTLISNITM